MPPKMSVFRFGVPLDVANIFRIFLQILKPPNVVKLLFFQILELKINFWKPKTFQNNF